ncbi:MAG: motility associated factor glycosyltransferase family protein [Spirochaetales bacterium]|nr:motility associated factor glycosyltransferase family protein [Spirochaetales bacterium]
MDYFAANMKILNSKIPELKEALERFRASDDLEIVPTPSGPPSALYRGISVHSRRDPVKEARSLIEREVDPAATVGVFYGFGLGYLPEEFIRSHPEAPCLVIEPDIGCFLKALSARDLAPVFEHRRSVFFLAAETAPVIRFLDSLDLSKVQVVRLRSLYDKDRAYYERTDALIQSFLRQRDVNRNTLKRFGRLWVRNLARNVRRLCLAPGIRSAEGVFSGLPAIVCAGGPSLDDILPRLPELSRKAVVIAVDTTLAAIKRSGVDPDFTVVCDPQYLNTRHLDPVRETGTLVVSESSTHPRIFRILGERAFFGSSIFPLGRALEAIVGEKGRLGAGGSVATTAWDCARSLGCAPIFMAGLDLGFPGWRTHFRGAHFEEAFHATSSRLDPQERRAYSYLREAAPFPVRDNAGGLVLTDHRMTVYKFWFETQMSLHPETATFNLSPGGVGIEGMPSAGIANALALPDVRPSVDGKMGSMRSLLAPPPDAAEKIESLRTGLARIAVDLESTAAAARAGVEAATQAKKRLSRRVSVSTQLKKLDEIDRAIRDLAAKDIAGFLAGPLIQEINRTSAGERKPEEWLDYSLELYRELEGSSVFHIAELKKALSFLQRAAS